MFSSVASDMNIQEYWLLIFRQTNAVGNQMYPNLSRLTYVLFSFLISNASVERAFSQLKLKTSLKHESLMSYDLKIVVAAQGETCGCNLRSSQRYAKASFENSIKC